MDPPGRYPKREIEKILVHGWDSLSLDRTEIDLRYLEQVVDESQTAALGYTLQYILTRLADGKKKADQLAMEAAEKIQKEGILSVTPKNYGARSVRGSACAGDTGSAGKIPYVVNVLFYSTFRG